MMAKYKAYPEYKNSGVEWLGEMPCHWNLQKAKYIFRKVQRATTEQDGIVTAFRDGQVTLRSNRRVDGFTNALKEIGYQGVKAGDLLVHAMDGFAGAIGISDSDGKCSPVCSVCIPWDEKGTHMRYYGYLVRQLAVTDFILSLAKGIRERSTEFRFNEFSGLLLSLPPLTEQAQIAKFLDHETAKIDNLIEKQQQLIELLKEKRQAVISHAVTKGLNPNAPMKDSGVEWLGEVPEHWEASRIGWLCNVGNGCTPSRENALFWQNGSYPWLNSSKVNDEKVLTTDQFVTPKALSECSLPKVRKGSVIMAITGEGKTRGTSALMMIDATINQHVAYITPRTTHKILSDFIHLWLQSKYQQIRTISAGWGSTKAAITCSDVKNYPIPVPPIKEQLEIIRDIEKEKDNFSNLLCICEKQIELLQERRTALISAAVTGKIDVRNWVAPEDEKAEVSQEATA
ncbi:MAG: restriction endonuclease subunit S [Serratia liquefaciens]|nr:restriction endonuclease subunit S [Serratia liquefaciens]